MTLAEAAKQAVNTNDPKLAGRVVDQMRDKCGLSYRLCAEAFRTYAGIDAAAFEALMQEADVAEE